MLKNNNFSNLYGLYHLYCKMGKTCHCTLQNFPSTTRLVTTVNDCGKFLHKKFSHTTAVPIIPLQEDLIKYPHNKSGYKADFIRSYKQLINEMS